MFESLAKNTLVPLVLRIGLAVIFLYHGIEKVQQGGGASWHKDLPVYEQLPVAWGELLAGLAMVLGLLTRLAAVGLAALMIGAIVTVHGTNGFNLANNGYEYNFAILVLCAGVILLGPGTLALNRFIRLRRKTQT